MALEDLVHALELRLDGVEAAVGALRARLMALERLGFLRGRFTCTCGWQEPVYLDLGDPPVSRKCAMCGGVAVFMRSPSPGGNG